MSGPSVLIVDDTPLNLKLLTVLLQTKGYNVTTATTAEEAVEILQTLRPRLLLLDIRLPGMDGLELARKLRADPVHAKLVIIAVTASAMKGDDDLAIAAGCDAYVTKPIDTRALPTLIEEHLARRS